jgi:hypothetical protein
MLLSANAYALGPVEGEVALRGGVGSDPDGNPLAFGVGARGGASFGALYAGASVTYHFGAGGSCNGGCTLPAGSQVAPQTPVSTLLYGVEGGYNVKWSDVTVRPQLGLGNLMHFYPGNSSESYFYLEPGVTMLVSLGTAFLGFDVGALLIPAGPPQVVPTESHSFDAALTAYVQLGAKF